MPIPPVQALLFDVFGTVVDWRTSVAREIEALNRAKGLSLDATAFAVAWRALYQPGMDKVRKGERPWVKLDVLHRENLQILLDRHGVKGLSEADIDHLNRAWHRLDPWPDSVAGLSRLKRRFILGTCSNGNVALMVNMAKYGGLPWDVILGAEPTQSYKPQPECYLRSCALLDLSPDACMMVAAHNNDLVAASKCGLKTAFVRRPSEHGPGQTSDREAEHAFDVVAESFIDLADKLDA
jgi:2-haloacid dehalogenase